MRNESIRELQISPLSADGCAATDYVIYACVCACECMHAYYEAKCWIIVTVHFVTLGLRELGVK